MKAVDAVPIDEELFLQIFLHFSGKNLLEHLGSLEQGRTGLPYGIVDIDDLGTGGGVTEIAIWT
jgi:hypothetical protein